MNMKLFIKYLLSKDPEDAVVKAFCISMFVSILSLALALTGLVISILSY